MTTQDDASRSAEENPHPLLPHLSFFDLPEEEIRRLQQILEEATGHPWRQLDARLAGIELLELATLLLDPIGWSYWRKHPPLEVPIREEASPAPAPDPRPFPIDLSADHDRHIEQELRILADEIRHVQRRPTHWRWVVVALYNALGHTLAKHLPADYQDDPGLGQLTRLFEAVAKKQPEIASARQAVEELDRLRTRWITLAVSEWPVKTSELPRIVADCRRIIQQLEPDLEVQSGGQGVLSGQRLHATMNA